MTAYFTDLLSEVKKRLDLMKYSRNTRVNYLRYLKGLFDYRQKNAQLNAEDCIKEYLLSLPSSSMDIAFSSVKFMYKQVLEKPCPLVIGKIRKRKRLPMALTRDEIWRILNQIKNRQHFLMVSLLYGSGLRVSEVVNLKVGDIDFQSETIFIRCGKGAKDRLTILPDSIKVDLKKLCNNKDSNSFLFITKNATKYSIRTLQTIFEKAQYRAKLNRNGSCHTLRHSFATSLLEEGIDLMTIKTLMGHRSIKTTSQYIHIVGIKEKKVKSPL